MNMRSTLGRRRLQSGMFRGRGANGARGRGERIHGGGRDVGPDGGVLVGVGEEVGRGLKSIVDGRGSRVFDVVQVYEAPEGYFSLPIIKAEESGHCDGNGGGGDRCAEGPREPVVRRRRGVCGHEGVEGFLEFLEDFRCLCVQIRWVVHVCREPEDVFRRGL